MRPANHHSQILPIPLERLRYLAGRLHSLGERPVFEFLHQIDRSAPLVETREVYARIAPLAGFIREHGGDLLPALAPRQGRALIGARINRSPSASLFAPLPMIEGGWPCIAADPPWNHRSNSIAKPGRNPRRHYDCLSLEQIASLPVKDVAARDAYLWFWVPFPFLVIGAHRPIMEGWGFKPSAMGFVRIKTNPRTTGPSFTERDLCVGTGHTTRKNCEYVILGRRGHPKRLARDVFEIVIASRREPSRKPDDVSARIERYCAGPRLELFARESRAGWTTWGAQARLFDPPDEAPPLAVLEAAE
jgi:N6-adenosine-specific RNA methylase IME4